MTLQAYRRLFGLALTALVAVFVILKWEGYQRDMEELQALRGYKQGVETQLQVSQTMRESFHDKLTERDEQKSANAEYRAHTATLTNEVAKNDPSTADFLSRPIPVRLREADRQARLARQLGSAGARSQGAGQAD